MPISYSRGIQQQKSVLRPGVGFLCLSFEFISACEYWTAQEILLIHLDGHPAPLFHQVFATIWLPRRKTITRLVLVSIVSLLKHSSVTTISRTGIAFNKLSSDQRDISPNTVLIKALASCSAHCHRTMWRISGNGRMIFGRFGADIHVEDRGWSYWSEFCCK